MTWSRRQLVPLIAPALGLLLLAAIAAQRLSYATPADAADYHQRVAEAVHEVPEQIGPWIGRDTEIQRAAQDLLNPNAILSRAYHHQETGQEVQLMIVHCKDARDMAGHYPPICYPANGWTQTDLQQRAWAVDGQAIPAADYEFQMRLPAAKRRMYVLNTLVMPGDELTTRMSELRQMAADYQSHFYGAGQIQFVFDDGMSEADRKRVFKRFYRHLSPAVEAMRSGVEK